MLLQRRLQYVSQYSLLLSIRRLVMGLFSSPKIEGKELQECLACFEAETRVIAFQTKEADLYNNLMVQYGNSITVNVSAANEARKAAKRLSQSATEVLQRHEKIKNVPHAASAMHYAWYLNILAYKAWAFATASAIESMANGMNPNMGYVQQMVNEYQKAWKAAKTEDSKFLKLIRASLNPDEIANIIARATSPNSIDSWEP